MEMVVVSPFPLPFSWQMPMVGVSCALLTAVEFLPLASLSGTEIQGGSDSPAAASCECSSSALGGAASPPGPAQGTGAAGFGLCVSRTPAACQRGCWRALQRKGCSGSASRLDLHWVHPQESCGSNSSSLLQLWFLAGKKPGKYSLCSFFRHFAREKTVSLVDPRLEFEGFSGFAAGQLHGAPSHCTCLCLSFLTCRALECALSFCAGLMPLQGAVLLLWASGS